MAFTVKGFYDPENPTAYAAQADSWGRWTQGFGQTDRLGQVVLEGFNVSPGSNARQVSISAGRALMPGLYIESSATELVTTTTASSTQQRYVVLEADWTARTVTPRIVGTSASLPALTREEGDVWQMPLASVTIGSSTGVFPTASIVRRKPIPRDDIGPLPNTPINAIEIGYQGSATIATVQVPDPGRPYWLDMEMFARFSGNAGYPAVQFLVNGNEAGQVVGPALLQGTGQIPVNLRRPSPVLVGPATVAVRMWVSAGQVGNPMSVAGGGVNTVTVIQHPA